MDDPASVDPQQKHGGLWRASCLAEAASGFWANLVRHAVLNTNQQYTPNGCCLYAEYVLTALSGRAG